MHFGYSIFLGSVIVDTTSTAIYVAPQSMKDEEAKALSHVLKTKPHVKLLDISNQHITDTGAKALADALCDHPAIQTLYVGGNKISDEGKNALTTACDAAGIASGRNIKIDLFFGEQRTKYSERPK
jgi:outer membrane receptor for monomeric catechols